MRSSLLFLLAGGFLAGAFATAAQGSSPEAGGSASATVTATRPGGSARASRIAPLGAREPQGHSLNLFRLVPADPRALLRIDPGAVSASSDPIQLHNPRTGVTCSMRIVEVKPTVDPGIFAMVDVPHLDPIVRGSASPCVE